MNFVVIFVVVSIGMLIVTSLMGVDFGDRDDHPILKHRWYIIAVVCVAWILFKGKSKDQRALRFTELAAALHREVVVIDEFERRFTINVDGRDFVVTENYDSDRRTDAAGWCLYSSTALLNEHWKDRNVKICKGQPIRILGLVLPRMVSGDDAFDDRFVITELAASAEDQKKSYREHMDESKNRSLASWLNESTRNALAAFFEPALPREPLLIAKSTLTHHVAWPYEGIDATTLMTLLRHQGAVANALDGGTGTPQFGLSI